MTTRTAEREQFLADVITTAVEGGTGYWAAVSGYRWSEEPGGETYATLHEIVDDPRPFGELVLGDEYELNIEAVAKGIGAIKRGEVAVRADLLDAIKQGDAENDGGFIDADAADVIVQAAFFNDVVYG